MSIENVADTCIAATTTCAVQLGVDPVVAPVVAGVLAVLVRHALAAGLAAWKARFPPAPPAPGA